MTNLAKPRIEDLVVNALFPSRTIDWKKAYERQVGVRPSRIRAKLIEGIYESSAPVPGEEPNVDLNALFQHLKAIAKDVIAQCGGTLRN